jgi:hypothetical protein
MLTPKDLNKTISGLWQFELFGEKITALAYKDLLKIVFDKYKKMDIKKSIDEIEKEIFTQNCARVPEECEDTSYDFTINKNFGCRPCGGSNVTL